MARSVSVVVALCAVLGACAGSQAVRRPDTLDASLLRWVPPGTNALGWIDMAGFRRSSLQELVDNDLQAVQALLDEVGSTDDSSTTRQLMPRLLDGWRKLDAVLVATRSRPSVPAAPAASDTSVFAPTPPTPPDEDTVFVFLARWTAADLEAIARISREPPAPTPPPATQPAVIEPPAPTSQPAPGADPLQAPVAPPPGESPFGGSGDLGAAAPPPPSTPPPEPMTRTVIAGKSGWTWGDSALVPVGGGIWLLANRTLVERLLGRPPHGGSFEHPELPAMTRDIGLFGQTFGYVGRADSVAQAEQLIPSTGLNERAPWPEVIETGDWFGLAIDADADVRLSVVVAPASAARVNATETRMRAWSERFARSGFSYFFYLHEAFEQARVQVVRERVELEVLIDEERASLAYARVSGMGILVGAVAVVFLSAMGGGLSALSGLGS